MFMLKNINWFTIIFTLEWMEKIKTEKKKKKTYKNETVRAQGHRMFYCYYRLGWGGENENWKKNNNETVWTIMLKWERAKSQNIYFRLQYAPKCPSK